MVYGFAVVIGIVLGIFFDAHAGNPFAPEVLQAQVTVIQPVKREVQLVVVPTKIEWTRARIEQEIRSTFPEDPETAVAVAKCESGLNPKAYNGKNRDGSSDGGVFQVNSVHDRHLRQLGLDKFNPRDNIKFARKLYDESGWRPWVCYTKKMY